MSPFWILLKLSVRVASYHIPFQPVGLGICLWGEAGDLWLFTSPGLAEGSTWFWREASLASVLQVGPVVVILE